jgi:hypothetical protein
MAARQTQAAQQSPATPLPPCRPASDSRLLYAAADPVWGLLGAQEQSLIAVTSAALDFRNLRSKFRLAPDASALAFRDLPGEASEAAFDTRQTAWVKAKKEWQAARTMAGKTNVDNWFERQRPQINGKAINLDAGEWSLSAAVAKSGDQVAIATNHNLRLYDRSARERWRTPAPGTPWQVNLSDDGRWLVGAFSDGTLRWYRLAGRQRTTGRFPAPRWSTLGGMDPRRILCSKPRRRGSGRLAA